MFDGDIIKVLKNYDNCYVNEFTPEQIKRIEKKLKCKIVSRPTRYDIGGFVLERVKENEERRNN